ncbi:MAG: alpha-L-fucosidase [Treponema sp.]|nr:alpha-L-fucosidase [Treponema sp.]
MVKKNSMPVVLACSAVMVFMVFSQGCDQEAFTEVYRKGFIDGALTDSEKEQVDNSGATVSDHQMEARRLVQIRPHERQIRWQAIEFYGFIHYGINTYTGTTGVEWGHGHPNPAPGARDPQNNIIEDQHPRLFRPTALNTDQWVEAMKSAGMKGVIVTAKHHDGFAMWETAIHNYAINHPESSGIDVLREISKSVSRGRIEMGIYMSSGDGHTQEFGNVPPWNNVVLPTGGSTDPDAPLHLIDYNELYRRQIRETMDGRYGNYTRCPQYNSDDDSLEHWDLHFNHKCGEIFAWWIDGAQGHVSTNYQQYYDYSSWYRTIRELQPMAVITVAGPDAGWIGNENAEVQPFQWSVLPANFADGRVVADASQLNPDAPPYNRRDPDFGKREMISQFRNLIWYPYEADVSITRSVTPTNPPSDSSHSRWFYRTGTPWATYSTAQLLSMYERSVGGNVTLLLNIPPNREGRFSPREELNLAAMGVAIRNIFDDNLLAIPGVTAMSGPADPMHPASNILTDDESYWRPRGEREVATITITLPEAQDITHVVLQEQIRQSQRIEQFNIQVRSNGEWVTVFPHTPPSIFGNYAAETVGWKKICRFPMINADAIRINITESRLFPTLRFAGAYLDKNI